jgi:hypothetical protein
MDNLQKYSTTTTTCLCPGFYYNKDKPCKHQKVLRDIVMKKHDFESVAKKCSETIDDDQMDIMDVLDLLDSDYIPTDSE